MKHYLSLAIVLALVVGAVMVVKSCERSVTRTAAAVQKIFTEGLSVRPQVTVNERTIYTQTAPIAELAVVTKDQWLECAVNEKIEVFHLPVPLTEKTMTAKALYRVKAGFDLRKPFLVQIDPKTGEVNATLPSAQILSLERIGALEFSDQSAWLNAVTPEDRERLLAELDQRARRAAEQSGILADAQRQAAERLQELAARNGVGMQLQWREQGG